MTQDRTSASGYRLPYTLELNDFGPRKTLKWHLMGQLSGRLPQIAASLHRSIERRDIQPLFQNLRISENPGQEGEQ